LQLIREFAARKGGIPVNVLTHCNAGWLACVDHGTAIAPIYAAHDAGLAVHVWVDETRPRNQGARLTAWELGMHGVPHTLVPDNAGGHLMQHGMVDLCIVGADRVTRRGDAANKIGTYLKALAAADNNVPFYAALPASSIDWSLRDGVREIPIESRGEEEVRFIEGMDADGQVRSVRLCPEDTGAANYGFDVTPGCRLSGLVTERGICPASEEGLLSLFPERRPVGAA
jgi:methylthioribose-1-phosphate isomerase